MSCALCLENNLLCDSHIVPEFFNKPLYDDSPKRYHGISTDPGERLDIKQKGISEELLCESYERKLSLWEGYARKKDAELILCVTENKSHADIHIYLAPQRKERTH